MKRTLSFALSLCLLAAMKGGAAESARTGHFKGILAKAPAPELPAKAAEMVREAPKGERESTTIGVVKAAVGLRATAAPAVVGAIARSVPEMAALAAATAAAEQPKQSAAIARAAVAAAHSKAGSIVVATCRAVPNEYRNIAVAAAQAAPGSGKEILEAVEAALPSLKPAIEKILAGYRGAAPSVAAVLSQAASTPVALTSTTTTTTPSAPSFFARGPAIGPPYIPLTSTPTNTVPGNSGDVPPGGRNYASP